MIVYKEWKVLNKISLLLVYLAAITEHNSEHYAISLKLDIEDGLADISSWVDNCEHRIGLGVRCLL